MSFSTPSNFPDNLKPKDRLGYQSAKNLTDSIKAASNTNASLLNMSSGSSGNSVGVNARSLQKPIWAVITNIVNVVYQVYNWDFSKFTAEQKSQITEFYPCDAAKKMLNPNSTFLLQVPTYSWSEVIDDIDLNRTIPGAYNRIMPFFNIQNNKPFAESTTYPLPCKSYSIPPESTNQGTTRRNPAYCINNSINRDTYGKNYSLIGVGDIALLWYGSGPYMFFQSAAPTLDRPNFPEQAYLWNLDHPS